MYQTLQKARQVNSQAKDTIIKRLPYAKFIKFCLVGSGGALIQLGMTYLLTEVVGLWYMLSLCIAIGLALIWNFTFNLKWTFKK